MSAEGDMTGTAEDAVVDSKEGLGWLDKQGKLTIPPLFR